MTLLSEHWIRTHSLHHHWWVVFRLSYVKQLCVNCHVLHVTCISFSIVGLFILFLTRCSVMKIIRATQFITRYKQEHRLIFITWLSCYTPLVRRLLVFLSAQIHRESNNWLCDKTTSARFTVLHWITSVLSVTEILYTVHIPRLKSPQRFGAGQSCWNGRAANL